MKKIIYFILLSLISCHYSNKEKNDNNFVGEYYSNSKKTMIINDDGSGESFHYIKYNQVKIPNGSFSWSTYFTDIKDDEKLEVIRCVWEDGNIADFSFWQDTKTLISFFKQGNSLKPFNVGIKRNNGEVDTQNKHDRSIFVNATPSFSINLPNDWNHVADPYDIIKLSALGSRKNDESISCNMTIIEGKKEAKMGEAKARTTFRESMPQATFIDYETIKDINAVVVTLKTEVNGVLLGFIVYQIDSKLNSYTITFTFDGDKINTYKQISKEIVQSFLINDM